ncbi:hypothetical protein HNP84_004152 [Thermocatellispora tengchongensis]|uniref:UBC core domain-containing protein n=1 Tax=Thermocatellispora tengchongensis TaxID=1073253 RepID=A0A840PAJ7_9ACTN|nr:effector-associated domain EAD1-containing protein [Thermocatellispora tengchongensis]MBB5134420.1 hypothetical protein [Thermocatellispora tengchongensis]
MKNRTEFLEELARVFDQQAEAEALLEAIGFPRGERPNWEGFRTAALYWGQVLREIENGRIDGHGPEALAVAAHRQYRGNAIFRRAAEEVPEPLPDAQVRVTPREGGRAAETPEEWPTLTFRGSEHYEEFVRLARQVIGPDTQLLYTGAEEAALYVPGGLDEARLGRLRREVADLGLGENVEVLFEVYPFQPHLFEQLRLVGPDQQVFYAENVPNTTPVRDIPHAVLFQYGEETRQDRFGRARRTVVDRVVPGATPQDPPQEQRLDPDLTLQQAGVREGDELHIRPESTAGAINPRLRRAALARVRNEIRDYERANPGFEIVYTDDEFLPTCYEVQFRAAGFEPPREQAADPADLRPVPRDVHKALIVLYDLFPIKAPAVMFTTPIFHPNVEPRGTDSRPMGWVCIGALGDDAYRTDLDFHVLCALIMDIAAYRNYGALPHGFLDAHGFLNSEAALWAVSEQGQEMIVRRGGRPLLPMIGIEETPPPKPIRIRGAHAPRPGDAAGTGR